MSYLNGVINEAKRVEWPKGQELVKMSTAVVQVAAVFGVIFVLMDVIISFILRGIGA